MNHLFILLNICEQNFDLCKNYAINSSIFFLILLYLYSSRLHHYHSLFSLFFWVLFQTFLNHFLFIFIITSFISIGFDLFFWYSFTPSLLTSYGVYSLFLFLLTLYISLLATCIESSSFLSWVKMLFIDLIHYLFKYFYFAVLCYFLLVSLFNRMINKFLSKLLIKSREYIPKVFSW